MCATVEMDGTIQLKYLRATLRREFVDRFKTINGSIMCRELLDCDLSTPEGQRTFVDKKLRDTFCTKLVRDAAEIIGQLLK